MVMGQNLRLLLLLGLAVLLAGAHRDGHNLEGEIEGVNGNHTASNGQDRTNVDPWDMPSYAGLNSHRRWMLAHVLFMIAAWVFVLPSGVFFSIARSRLALPVQITFLLLNCFGVVTGTIYNINTPDLYENNAHHKIGWIATWVVTAQVIMSLLFVYSGRHRMKAPIRAAERSGFLPVTLYSRDSGRDSGPYSDHRWSGDSGQGTEPPSPSNASRSVSPLDGDCDFRHIKTEVAPEDESEDDMEMPTTPLRRRPSWFQMFSMDRYLAGRVPALVSGKMLKVAMAASEVIDRLILVLGFIALTSGVVTYAGIFRADNIFNGLAHFIKGGIFFWYGLLTLARWMGCFADLGWAWNAKPTASQVGWKARLPSAEFVESFVIFLYGITNVFLEHLAAWGEPWVAQDLEHVSISIMFFGGGLAGMLVESKTVRSWLNTVVDMMPACSELDATDIDVGTVRGEPRNYSTSLNPIPALIILLLGIMMSSHHQDSMVSTVIHKQWGTLLCGFSLARGLTYLIMFLAPPRTIYPSRPPTELVAAFCLISGGITFMASTRDLVHLMEKHHLMAMFTFTVTMGLTAFLMAYQIAALALKGWAVRRELRLKGQILY